MNMPSGVSADELDLDDERGERTLRGPLPFTFDIETIPQRRFWPAGEHTSGKIFQPPTEYEVDQLWRRRKWEEMQTASEPGVKVWEPGDFEDIIGEEIRQCSAPLHATGQLPACHPTTAHIVSVSFGKIFNPETIGEIEVDVTTTQMDDFLKERVEPAPAEADYEIMSKPGLDELSDHEIVRVEKKVLARTVQLMEWAASSHFRFVSFNAKGFDFPMVRWRCAVLGIKPPQLNWYEMLYPYRHIEHIDLRLLFSDGNKMAKGTLSMWADAMGFKSEESGGKVLDWSRRGEWGEIRRYGEQEMETLMQMFLQCQEAM